MSTMTKRERIKATLAGHPVDRPAVAFWRHWPGDDQGAESLARACLDYQRRFDFDFLKITPSHVHCVEDYGVKHAYRGHPVGVREQLENPVKRVQDWDRLEPLDVYQGALGKQIECLKIVVEKRDPETPVLFTMFNPLAVAFYLSGDDLALFTMRREPKRFARALEALTETGASFARAAIAEGADGVFLSTRHASYDFMSEQEYRQFGIPSDLAVLRAAGGGWFNALHLHGKMPMFEVTADYPVQAMNWHDRTSWPSLAEAARLFPGALMGGIEQFNVLHFGTPAEVLAQMRDALAQTGGRRHVVAAGCTYPITVPEGNLLAVRQAVESETR